MEILVLLSIAATVNSAPFLEDTSGVMGEKLPDETPHETFVRVDKNIDDVIDFDDFLHTDRVYERAMKEEFDMIDTDEDGRITRAEYDAHYSKMKAESNTIRAKYFAGVFEEFDGNSDMILSEEEVRQLLRKRFFVAPRDNFSQIFGVFDTDKSGGLDLSEYINLDANFPFEETDPIKVSPGIKKIEKTPKLLKYSSLEN